MGATQTGDVNFQPKVWSDHIMAYFDRKMGLGSLALVNKDLQNSPGETVNFPYFKAIGAAQKPAQDEGLAIDPLQDDAFSCTVYEIGKAVGWKDKAKRVSAANPKGIKDNSKQDAEAQRQMARVIAEQVDEDLITMINTNGAYGAGYVATTSAETCNVQKILSSQITGFGDKHTQSIAVAMHSQDYLSLMTDSNAGFLKADATDPFYGKVGFVGRLLGMALFVLDTVPEVAGGINGKKAWYHFIFKADPFGIIMAEELNVERDRDIIHREDVVTSTMWLGMVALHGKVSANDKRITRGAFASALSA